MLILTMDCLGCCPRSEASPARTQTKRLRLHSSNVKSPTTDLPLPKHLRFLGWKRTVGGPLRTLGSLLEQHSHAGPIDRQTLQLERYFPLGQRLRETVAECMPIENESTQYAGQKIKRCQSCTQSVSTRCNRSRCFGSSGTALCSLASDSPATGSSAEKNCKKNSATKEDLGLPGPRRA